MPREGAIILSDLAPGRLHVACAPCGRSGSYSVARLRAKHGDAKLTDLLGKLAGDCPRLGLFRDSCRARFEFGPPAADKLSAANDE